MKGLKSKNIYTIIMISRPISTNLGILIHHNISQDFKYLVSAEYFLFQKSLLRFICISIAFYFTFKKIYPSNTPAKTESRSFCLNSTPAKIESRSFCLNSTPAKIGSGSFWLFSTPAKNGSRSFCLNSTPAKIGSRSFYFFSTLAKLFFGVTILIHY